MMDSQRLLEEYAERGSEEAFQEVVARYIGLVYATGLRLVEGNTQLAEDVTQTVFLHLARNAREISTEVMLGGWLYRHTYHVAAPMMRAERRRRAREREAMEMNTPGNDADMELAQVAPVLDELIMDLGKEDRAAILLRFFERRDFRSIAQVLGSTEDAARMRVNRALEKLHLRLQRRGVTLSLAALGTGLGGEALTAAPAGLAAGIAGTALSGSAATGGISGTLVKVLAMIKMKVMVTAIMVVGGTGALLYQHDQAKLWAQEEALRQQSNQMAQLAAENERLMKLVQQANDADARLQEIPKLRAEAEILRNLTSELSTLREENRRLVQKASESKTPLQRREEQMARMELQKNWILALILYSEANQGQLPGSFEQAAPFWEREFGALTNMPNGQLEIVHDGPWRALTNMQTIITREKTPFQNNEGIWCKAYGLADGSVQCVRLDLTEKFEKEHMVTPAK